jgi:hypothetical protein
VHQGPCLSVDTPSQASVSLSRRSGGLSGLSSSVCAMNERRSDRTAWL